MRWMNEIGFSVNLIIFLTSLYPSGLFVLPGDEIVRNEKIQSQSLSVINEKCQREVEDEEKDDEREEEDVEMEEEVEIDSDVESTSREGGYVLTGDDIEGMISFYFIPTIFFFLLFTNSFNFLHFCII